MGDVVSTWKCYWLESPPVKPACLANMTLSIRSQSWKFDKISYTA